LKRSVGQPLREAHSCTGLFYRLLPYGIPLWQEETYFLVATLYPLADAAKDGDFGVSLQRARQTSNGKGMDRRVEILLDADANQLPFRLRQAIRYLKANEVRVNWHSLLEDLFDWSKPGRRVQQRWARAYFIDARPEISTTEPTTQTNI
jgi:CRISPR type I-E-associated protein CasB/Cse2